MATLYDYEVWQLTRVDENEPPPAHLLDWHRKWNTKELVLEDRDELLRLAGVQAPDPQLPHEQYQAALKEMTRKLDDWHRENWPFTRIRYRQRGRPRHPPGPPKTK